MMSMGGLSALAAAFWSRDADICFNFSVLLDGIPVGDFMSVENLARSIEPYSYQEGGKNDAPHMLIGPAKNGELTLKWGLMNRSTLWDWMSEVEVGSDFRRSVQILQLTRGQIPVRAYNIDYAWPIGWKGASLNAGDSAIAVEEITLVYSKLSVVAIPLPF